jgi:hypothetical protein
VLYYCFTATTTLLHQSGEESTNSKAGSQVDVSSNSCSKAVVKQ